MSQNTLFQQLRNGVRKANVLPTQSTLAMGFSTQQMLTGNLKKPRLLWFDIVTKKFYDQGDSTKIKKEDWYKVNQDNFKKKEMKDLSYYIPINSQIIDESNKPDYRNMKIELK